MSDSTIITTEQTATEPRAFQDADAAAAYLNQRIAEAAEREQQEVREQEELRQREDEQRRQDAIGNLRGYVEQSVDADVLAALQLRYAAERSGTYSYTGYAAFTLQPEGVELHLSFIGMGDAQLHDPTYSILNYSQSINVHLNPLRATRDLLLGIATFRARFVEIAAKRAAETAAANAASGSASAAANLGQAQPAEQTEPAQPQIINETSYSRTLLLSAETTDAKTVTLHSTGTVEVFSLSAYSSDAAYPSEPRLNSTRLTSDEFTLLTTAHAAWMDSLTAGNAVTADDEPPF